jgi:hypothetical protein
MGWLSQTAATMPDRAVRTSPSPRPASPRAIADQPAQPGLSISGFRFGSLGRWEAS